MPSWGALSSGGPPVAAFPYPPPAAAEAPLIETLIARAPAVLMLAVLALLSYVALLQQDEPVLLAAGAPAAIVLALYLRSGRGGR